MKIPPNKQYVMFGGAFVLANKLQAVADKRMNGLSTKQWFLLRNLSDFPADPPPTITTLAKETDTSRQNVTKMLDVLQKQGYAELKESEEDRRSQGVILTQAGKEILRQAAQEAVPFFAELFSNISEQETEAAANVMIKLIAKLNKMQEEAV